MNNMLFSILIANYNNGHVIMQAIDSVRQQTYKNWEIIIVDDGSTDNSIDVYKLLAKDHRIHIYYNKQNYGCGYTKRKCVELASGTLCGFLDPDDTLTSNALELEAKIHQEHPRVSIIYSRVNYCRADLTIIGSSTLPDFSDGKTYFDYRNHGAMNFASFKRSLYNKTSGINPKAMAGIDQDLYFKMEEVGEIYALDKVTYNYVTEGNVNSIACSGNKFYQLWYWNLMIRTDTCRRRGLQESILYDDLATILEKGIQLRTEKENEETINTLVREQLFPAVRAKELEMCNTIQYKIGKFILTPFRWLKPLLSKL